MITLIVNCSNPDAVGDSFGNRNSYSHDAVTETIACSTPTNYTGIRIIAGNSLNVPAGTAGGGQLSCNAATDPLHAGWRRREERVQSATGLS